MSSESEIACWRTVGPSLEALNFHDGAAIYGQGDRLAGLFWLLKGIVKLCHITEEGIQLTIAVLGPGDVFGSSSAAETSEHMATSLGEVRVAKITREDLTNLVGASPVFAALLCAKLEAWQKRTERKLVTIRTKTIEMRLVETLCELALVFGAPCPHGYALEIRLTQQDIADLVYASRPAVTKAMTALRRRGVLDYRRELICVNHAALQSIAQSRPVDL